MRFNTEHPETTQEYKKRIREKAMANLGIDIDKTEQNQRHDFKHEVSRLLLNDNIKGRPSPMSVGKINPTRVKCNRKIQYNTYPRKLKTDKQKFLYIRDLFVKNELKPDIFIDLASVLEKVKMRTVMRIVKLQGQTIGGSEVKPLF